MSSDRYTKMKGSPKFDKPILEARRENDSSEKPGDLYMPRKTFKINRKGSDDHTRQSSIVEIQPMTLTLNDNGTECMHTEENITTEEEIQVPKASVANASTISRLASRHLSINVSDPKLQSIEDEERPLLVVPRQQSPVSS